MKAQREAEETKSRVHVRTLLLRTLLETGWGQRILPLRTATPPGPKASASKEETACWGTHSPSTAAPRTTGHHRPAAAARSWPGPSCRHDEKHL